MHKSFLFGIFLILPAFAFTQGYQQSPVDFAKALSPKGKNTQIIGQEIAKTFDSELDRLKAAYAFTATHIAYDQRMADLSRNGRLDTNFSKYALAHGLGFCQHYAQTFREITQSMGFKSYLVGGYVKNQNGEIAERSHAWNAVLLDSGLYFFDPTFGSGYTLKGRFVPQYDESYFMVPPQKMIKTHKPFHPVFQGLSNPKSHPEFMSGTKKESENAWSIVDSLKARSRLSELEKAQSLKYYLKQEKNFHPLLKERYLEAHESITSQLYNQGAQLLNSGIDHYNAYQKLRTSNSEKAQRHLETAEEKALRAQKIFSQLQSREDNLQSMIRRARKESQTLISAISKQGD